MIPWIALTRADPQVVWIEGRLGWERKKLAASRVADLLPLSIRDVEAMCPAFSGQASVLSVHPVHICSAG